MKKVKAPVKNQANLLIFVGLFAIVGVSILIISTAATPSFSVEPESGQLSGSASQVTDTTASGGKAIKFGDAVVTPPPGGDTVVIAVAGDIGTSGNTDAAVANRIKADTSIQAVLALGDIAYNSATNEELKYYNDTWGAFKSKTYPVIGNHEYFISPQPYRDYWNSAGAWTSTPQAPAAVSREKFYYSFNLGSWHLIALDSEKDIPTQTSWLQQDLAANPKTCTIAFWHSPYWAGSSPGGSSAGVSIGRVKPFMEALVSAKADIVFAGHEHAYVSFPKLSVSNNQADANGIRTWVSGMGGTGPTTSGLQNKYAGVVYIDGSNNTGATGSGGASGGYLRMELKPTSYSWQYIDTNGAVRHSGSDTCRP